MDDDNLTTGDKFWLIVFAAAFIVGLIFAPPAKASDLGPGDRGYRHKEHHHTYSKWHNQNGTHCCNTDGEHGDGDCRVTKARWNFEHETWEALVDGRWVLIAASRWVLNDYGLGPFASVCVGRDGYIFCFDPPDISG